MPATKHPSMRSRNSPRYAAYFSLLPRIDSPALLARHLNMSSTTDFIAELIRAANEVRRLDNYQRRRLLGRAVATIREGREQVDIPASKTAADAVIDLVTMTGSISRRSDDEVKAALLNAASMIRTLKIVLDAKDEVLRGE